MSLSEDKLKSFAGFAQSKYIEPENLEVLSTNCKDQTKTIATLNGSFDLLHPGHLEMIYQASLQADILLVLLNTDDSIRAYKGSDRPIQPLEIRLQNIAALEMVDYVSWFSETDPISTLDKIRPNVHVNGSEYGEDCIEADVVKKHGGRIHIVNLIEGYSTTQLIDKIRLLCV